jgi:hypothetical protein
VHTPHKNRGLVNPPVASHNALCSWVSHRYFLYISVDNVRWTIRKAWKLSSRYLWCNGIMLVSGKQWEILSLWGILCNKHREVIWFSLKTNKFWSVLRLQWHLFLRVWYHISTESHTTSIFFIFDLRIINDLDFFGKVPFIFWPLLANSLLVWDNSRKWTRVIITAWFTSGRRSWIENVACF